MESLEPVHMKTIPVAHSTKSLPFIEHGLGHFQSYGSYGVWSAPKMRVVCEYLPVRSSMGAAGYDLYAAEDCTMDMASCAIINTGLQLEIPVGHYGKIEGLTSLAFKYNVVPFGGIIDEDYRGLVQVKLFNNGPRYRVNKGDRIAQLILHRYCVPTIEQVETLTT
jgi:deoxyuridine 5'-triphosphate nucleotidohydrolase|tara:strand:- start:4793 stop:5287 length:495 start_codon:yes stop_codon:yes gene_type:complete